ncbi:MAG: hypothetical protein ACRBBN_09535 [Methyloligellaceae bacterium]
MSSLSNASFTHINDPVAQGSPIALYGHVAKNIKTCWLKQPDPLLKNYAFFAKAAPGDSGGQATITLNELTKDGKKGLTAFKIDFLPLEGGKTNVRIDNFRFSDDMAVRLKKNVRYWSAGHAKCEAPGPDNNIVSVPAGVKIKPIQSQ